MNKCASKLDFIFPGTTYVFAYLQLQYNAVLWISYCSPPLASCHQSALLSLHTAEYTVHSQIRNTQSVSHDSYVHFDLII